jgi:hypothetical protein
VRFAPAAWTRANQVDDAVGRACVQGADPPGRQDLLDGDQKRAGSLKDSQLNWISRHSARSDLRSGRRRTSRRPVVAIVGEAAGIPVG